MANKVQEAAEIVPAEPQELKQSPSAAYASSLESTRKKLAAQPKRTVRIKAENKQKPGDWTVQINGYLFHGQKGVDVQVPESVYKILVDAERI